LKERTKPDIKMNRGTAKCENTSIITFIINNRFIFCIFVKLAEVWMAITANIANPLRCPISSNFFIGLIDKHSIII
jgi:hypothetical protein